MHLQGVSQILLEQDLRGIWDKFQEENLTKDWKSKREEAKKRADIQRDIDQELSG